MLIDSRHDDRPLAGARLLADVGGTNARFAWADAPGAPLRQVRVLPGAEHPTLEDAVRSYLRIEGLPVPQAACVAIANPVNGDRIQMTNHHWSFSVAELRIALGLQRLVVLNDFTALAMALPQLGSESLRQVGGGIRRPGGPMAVLGPGTGLGVSGLLPAAGGAAPLPLSGEGGHVTLGPLDAREAVVLERLRRRFGHASAERALSGPGLVNLYEAVCATDGQRAQALSAADVSERALAHSDPACTEALHLFCSLLGNVAGNLALTLGAVGGVYIGGGIVPRLGAAFDASPFRASFEAKGRFSAYLAAIPCYVIDSAVSPSLLGAALALR
jgi:glucokinase